MRKMEEIRRNFTKMRGGRMISAESYILGLILLFVISMVMDSLPYAAIAAAIAVGFVFPILIGVFKSLAWLAAVLFSFIWAFIAFVFVGAIADSTAGLFAAGLFFVVSFAVHKNYSGLSFQAVSRKNRDLQISPAENMAPFENASFCPKCGRRIRTSDGHCDVCDR